MGLSVGIVGLPNVGKSTLFNAITNANAQAQNYPFCTIEPNSGIVPINDNRLDILAKISKTEKIIHATIEFVDIAGLVKGASKGEGLGNKFLSHIREISAIAHVVRCFEDTNITHVNGKINPADDIETINLELILADLEMAEKMLATVSKKALHAKDKDAKIKYDLILQIKETLENNKPVRSLEFDKTQIPIVKSLNFLTYKKMIYVANISEEMIGETTPLLEEVKSIAEKAGDEFAIISAQIEQEISELEPNEKSEYLKELGIEYSGLDLITHKCFNLLGLQTYITTGEKETRAWTIKKGDTAPTAAGVIHSDFERGFIRANIVTFDEFVTNNGWKGAKEKGLMRQEGKDYVMKDGDIVEFLFNV